MIIYLTTNNIREKVYVGKLVNERKKTYLGSGTYVRRAIKKYGKENFSRITLEDGITDHDYLCEREKYWIAFYDSTNPDVGYNLTEGGGGLLGFHHSEETLEKLSESHKGQIPWNKGISPSKETLEKLSESHKGQTPWNKGISPSEETLEKLSESHKGQIPWNRGISPSKETLEEMSNSHKGQTPWNKGISPSEETLEKMSKSKKGIKHPRILKKEMVLKVLKLLEEDMPVSKILNEIKIGENTVYKIKNGGYDDIYDLPKKTK